MCALQDSLPGEEGQDDAERADQQPGGRRQLAVQARRGQAVDDGALPIP